MLRRDLFHLKAEEDNARWQTASLLRRIKHKKKSKRFHNTCFDPFLVISSLLQVSKIIRNYEKSISTELSMTFEQSGTAKTDLFNDNVPLIK